jgi:hypothetical protein
MGELDYDIETLNSRDYSYPNQLRDMEREGWEIDPTMEPGDTVYLRRHQRVAELQHLANLKRRYLRFERAADGAWIAKFVPPIAAVGDEVFRGETCREAAEAAWRWIQGRGRI